MVLSGIKVESETTWRFLPLIVNGFEASCHFYSISRLTKTYSVPNRPSGGRMYPWLLMMKWALLLLLGTQTKESVLLANEAYNEALEMSSLDSEAFSAYHLTDGDCQSAAWQNRVCRLQWNVVARPAGCGMLSLPWSVRHFGTKSLYPFLMEIPPFLVFLHC